MLVLEWVPFLIAYDADLSVEGIPEASLEAMRQAEQYNGPRRWSGLIAFFRPLPALMMVLASGVAVSVERRYGRTRWRWPARILFLLGFSVVMRILAFPYGLSLFLHDQAFGVTRLSLPEQMWNLFVSTPVPMASFLFASLLTYCCMPLLGRWWWLGSAVLLFVVFHVIPEKVSRMQPLDPIETRTVLEDGPVRDALRAVADAADMDLEFYVVDAGERTRRINMYLTGRVGREYVVITDTALAACTPDELKAILAHELGHQETRFVDVINGKVLTGATLLIVMLIVHLWSRRREIDEAQRLQTLIRILLVSKLVTLPVIPLTSALNRYREREADEFALALTANPDALRDALLTVARANLTPYDEPAWSYYLAGTHPRLKDRLALAGQWSEKDAPDSPPRDLTP